MNDGCTYLQLDMSIFYKEATSDLSLTIMGKVPHLIVVREEGNFAKTGFLRKNRENMSKVLVMCMVSF